LGFSVKREEITRPKVVKTQEYPMRTTCGMEGGIQALSGGFKLDAPCEDLCVFAAHGAEFLLKGFF